jgi:hypothetical protein
MGSHHGFRQNAATFSANAMLPLPNATAAAAAAAAAAAGAGGATGNFYPPPDVHIDPGTAYPPGSGSAGVEAVVAINPKFIAHGWAMAVGWGLLIPLGVWAVRYGRPPPDRDASDRPATALQALRSAWFRCHWVVSSAGLCSAFAGSCLAYLAVQAESGDGGHLGRGLHSSTFWLDVMFSCGLRREVSSVKASKVKLRSGRLMWLQ